MAKAICDFDDMLTEARKFGASKPCDVIAEFHNYMDDVREAVSIKENEPTVYRKGRIGSQKGGERLQDLVDIDGITRSDLSVTNCASCKHTFYTLLVKPSLRFATIMIKLKWSIARKWVCVMLCLLTT